MRAPAAGRALVPRGAAGGCFASVNILLKSLVEQKGALSTLKRCTGAAHNACAHCLRVPRACQGRCVGLLLLLPEATNVRVAGLSSEVRQRRRASSPIARPRLCAHAPGPHRPPRPLRQADAASAHAYRLPHVNSSAARTAARRAASWRAPWPSARVRAHGRDASSARGCRVCGCSSPSCTACGQWAAPRRPRGCRARQSRRALCRRRLRRPWRLPGSSSGRQHGCACVCGKVG